MGRKAKYRKYLILILLLACFILALYVVCNTKNSLTFLDRNPLNCDRKKERGIVLLSIPLPEALAIAYCC